VLLKRVRPILLLTERPTRACLLFPDFRSACGRPAYKFSFAAFDLLALVAAFAGRDQVLAAYRHAVEAGYRFYSYGDCMLIR